MPPKSATTSTLNVNRKSASKRKAAGESRAQPTAEDDDAIIPNSGLKPVSRSQLALNERLVGMSKPLLTPNEWLGDAYADLLPKDLLAAHREFLSEEEESEEEYDEVNALRDLLAFRRSPNLTGYLHRRSERPAGSVRHVGASEYVGLLSAQEQALLSEESSWDDTEAFERAEFLVRSRLKRGMVKQVMAAAVGASPGTPATSTGGVGSGGNASESGSMLISDQSAVAVAGVAKLFVIELTNAALATADDWGDRELSLDHIHEAYRRLHNAGQLPYLRPKKRPSRGLR